VTDIRPLPFDPIVEARRLWSEHGWADAADGMAAVTSVMRAQQVMLARVDEVLRPFELTFARYEVLMLLLFSRRGALPLSTVGSRLQVHPASVTNVIDRLEAHGLVRRTPHPTDRRTTLAELTERGRQVATEATDELNAKVFRDPGLEAERVLELVDVLTDLRRHAGDF
jgi:DNA-binding MarR family transcriptional regulator